VNTSVILRYRDTYVSIMIRIFHDAKSTVDPGAHRNAYDGSTTPRQMVRGAIGYTPTLKGGEDVRGRTAADDRE